MSNNVMGTVTWRSAIAIAQGQDRLRAVELRKEGSAIEVLWVKSADAEQKTIGAFAAECGATIKTADSGEAAGGKIVVAGFDSAGAAFYHVELPAAKEEEDMEAMVRMQAESLLPLPVEQMELGWRTGRAREGNVYVTIAAGRRTVLAKFVNSVKSFEPERILLDCEGVANAWKTLFGAGANRAVVLSAAGHQTQACLVEDGQLRNAVVLDMGTEDFSQTETSLLDDTERFVQDMKSALELFGFAESAALPVFVLSDGSDAIEAMVERLASEGIKAKAVQPDVGRLGGPVELGAAEVYEYRVPIGLALMALDETTDELDVFGRLYEPPSKRKKKSLLYSPRLTGAVAVMMLVLLVIVSYAVDVARPGAIEKRLKASGTDVESLVRRGQLMKKVAQERPDLLELLRDINGTGSSGVRLDSFHFKKGQVTSISGQAESNEQLYAFQKSLLTNKGIKEVEIQSATPVSGDSRTGSSDRGGSDRAGGEDRGNDGGGVGGMPGGGRGGMPGGGGRGNKVTFTINFHYKNFTKKGG